MADIKAGWAVGGVERLGVVGLQAYVLAGNLFHRPPSLAGPAPCLR
jgi:hypothetical protein